MLPHTHIHTEKEKEKENTFKELAPLLYMAQDIISFVIFHQLLEPQVN
jgi:hypothetical protein